MVMAQPVSDREFTTLMAALGPFERNARVAVALSGGPDSMALCVLADAWARRRGGRVVALTVDHGLRSDSATEAAVVGGWMGTLGIAHQVLAWEGTKPRSGVQAKARAARYELLTGWCRRAGILHLVLAHEMEDQAETILMRLTRGSGRHGLAGMSAVSETSGVRILRPLLGVGRERLTATLRARRRRGSRTRRTSIRPSRAFVSASGCRPWNRRDAAPPTSRDWPRRSRPGARKARGGLWRCWPAPAACRRPALPFSTGPCWRRHRH